MKKNTVLLIISMFLISSCGYGDFGKYDIDLDESNSANIISINDTIKSIYVKYHHKTGVIDTVKEVGNSVIINGYIEQGNYDGVFLLVKQKPIDSICECISDCLDDKYPPSNNRSSYKLCEDAFKKYDKYLYWIILVKTDDVYGPFEKDEYLEMCKKLNVPEDLINQKKKLIYKIFDNINTKP